MNFWRRIANLGVTEKMPVYMQKSTIFFNVAMRISIICMLLAAFLMYIIKGMVYTPAGFLLAMPVIMFSLFLNYKGKVSLSVLIISIFFPIYFVTMSLVAKAHGEGLEYTFYVLPRMGLIIITIISFLVLGFDKLIKALTGAVVGLLCFFLFDYIHHLFDLGVKDTLSGKNFNFEAIMYILGAVFSFFIAISSFMQKINTQYEKIVTDQRDSIKAKNEELKSQKDEIETQRDQVTEQKNIIEEMHDQLNKSIDYATRLQASVLPENKILENYVSDNFIFFKPKDKVSGDFYWWTHIEGNTVIAGADCTGHGVPGAFMSMLGISFLREIVTKEYITHPGIILNKLRKNIINTLKQRGETGEQKDGMDISLICINHENGILQYAGANNSIYVISENIHIELQNFDDSKKRIFELPDTDRILLEIKADRMPIGIYQKMEKFNMHEIKISKGDIIYLFSDGFPDQFGGDKGKKYLYKSFKKLLLSNSYKSMDQQCNILEREIESWKGDQYTQIDDILVLGIKI